MGSIEHKTETVTEAVNIIFTIHFHTKFTVHLMFKQRYSFIESTILTVLMVC